MAEQSVIVWDLETVPDLSAAARMLDLGDAPESKVRGGGNSGVVSGTATTEPQNFLGSGK